MPDKIRTAIFGGTFNPIHNGHIAIVRSILEQKLADEVWLMVTPCNPWKEGQNLLDNDKRLELVRLAVSGIEGAYASDYEFRLPVPSYTANTLRHLRRSYRRREFILAIGADNWAAFRDWRDWQYIVSEFKLIVYPRPGYSADPDIPEADVSILDCPLHDISSTAIRQAVASGQPIDGMVPEQVTETVVALYR